MHRDSELAVQAKDIRRNLRKRLPCLRTAAHLEGPAAPLRREDPAIRPGPAPDAARTRMALDGPDFLQALPAALSVTDAEGWRPVLGPGRRCGSWRAHRADGTPLPHDCRPMAVALRENRELRDMDAIAERPVGSRVRLTSYPTLLRSASNIPVGVRNILIDISPFQGRDNQAC
ncbi:hypothetical protein ACFOYU_03730 [Microvirga sp. GCM10011540]|uniref:hypothetical protein n=1 Tax=Microvirga sp. GCM10011540 TaxID=3317338 RepID=UPI00360AF411